MKATIRLTIALAATLGFGPADAAGQSLYSTVESILQTVRLDSLTRYVSDLSGETPIWVSDSVLIITPVSETTTDSVWVTDTFVRLPNRFEGANDAATAYLVEKLQSFGYDSVVVDDYPDAPRFPTTKNVLAFKPGADPNGLVWLLGAHYDSVLPAPGADDNASGTAVVLETARVLADVSTSASVIFGLWDTEEAGLFGSDYFAERAAEQGMQIDGVMNIDMVGWDGDLDRTLEIHDSDPAAWFGEYVASTAANFGLALNPHVVVPGIGRSDHVSFRNRGFPAILVIEEVGPDFNPYYHSPQDVLENFDTGFFFESAKLVVATMSQLVITATTVALENARAPYESSGIESLFPNPTTDVLNIRFDSGGSGFAEFHVHDLLGRRVATFSSAMNRPGIGSAKWHVPAQLPNGLYFVALVGTSSRSPKIFHLAR